MMQNESNFILVSVCQLFIYLFFEFRLFSFFHFFIYFIYFLIPCVGFDFAPESMMQNIDKITKELQRLKLLY